MSEIGKAYVQIEPTAKGISKKIEGEFASVGSSAGSSFSAGFVKSQLAQLAPVQRQLQESCQVRSRGSVIMSS